MILDNPTSLDHRILKRVDELARASGADRFGTLPVVSRPDLFTPQWDHLPAGLSIAEIIASIKNLPADFKRCGVVTIDRKDGMGSQEIPRAMWPYVRPKASGPVEIIINLWLPPEGPEVRQIVALVATIAVIAAAAFVTGGGAAFLGPLLGLGTGAFVAGSFGAAALGAAIAVGGALAIRAITPPPSVPALEAGSTGAIDKQLTPASLSGNVLRPGSPIPHTMGTRKIFPPFVVKPLIELVGDDEYATAVFGLSGAHQLNNLRADGVPFDDIAELEYETREGHSTDTAITLIDRQSKTDATAVELSPHKVDADNPQRLEDQTTPANSLPQWHRVRAERSPNEVWYNISFPEGLFDADNAASDMSAPVRVRFREVGDVTWINVPEIHFTFRQQQRFQKDIRLIFEAAPALPTPGTNRCPRAALSHVPMRADTFISTGGFSNVSRAFDGLSSLSATISATSAYLGANYSSTPRSVKAVVVWPNTTTGFIDGGSNLTLKLRGKNGGAPSSPTDGTELGSTGSFSDVTTSKLIESNDTSTTWQYLWIEMSSGGSVDFSISEIQFFGDNDYSWVANSYFYSAVSPHFMDSTNIGSTGVRRIGLYEDRAEVYLDTGTFPLGDYEIEVKRGAAYANSIFTNTGLIYDTFRYVTSGGFHIIPYSYENVFHKMVRQRLSLIWNEHPLPNAPGNLALIAVKVKNRQVSNVSVDAAKYVYDLTTGGWDSFGTSANPAAHVRAILTGDLNADPVPEDLVDDTSLQAFWTHCNNEGFEVNAVVEGISAATAALLATGCGYGRLRQSDVFGVIIDKDRSNDAPVQTFTSRNSRGYRFEKPFARLPSGFRVIYYDAANDYQETELIVLDPDGDQGSRYEEIRYDGLVTEAEVEARALFDLKQARLRMATHSFDSNAQAIKCQRGDLIGFNHPVLNRQFAAAYVKEVLTSSTNITGLALDASIPIRSFFTGGFFTGSFFLNDPTAVGIRLPDEADITAEIDVALDVDETRVITFLDPIPGPIDGLDVGTLVYAGPVDQERLRLIVGEIQPKAGPSFPNTIVAVDEAPELWAA